MHICTHTYIKEYYDAFAVPPPQMLLVLTGILCYWSLRSFVLTSYKCSLSESWTLVIMLVATTTQRGNHEKLLNRLRKWCMGEIKIKKKKKGDKTWPHHCWMVKSERVVFYMNSMEWGHWRWPPQRPTPHGKHQTHLSSCWLIIYSAPPPSHFVLNPRPSHLLWPRSKFPRGCGQTMRSTCML